MMILFLLLILFIAFVVFQLIAQQWLSRGSEEYTSAEWELYQQRYD